MGTPLGTQKSLWGPPGGHLSSQGRLLEGIFLRTYFLHEIRPPKLTQKVIFFGTLDVAKT